jgi:hypothetical protein
MNNNRTVYPLFLILVSMWWGWTVLVDFFIVRSVFSTVTDFFQAGELGILLFSKLNNLEIVVSSFIVALLSFQYRKKKSILFFLGISLVPWIIVMFYFSYLTPKLTLLSEMWKQADFAGVSSFGGISDVQQEHQKYHQLYITLDSVKLFFLSLLLIFGVWKQEKMI